MKIGLVDLDTTHPEKWIPIERDLEHEVVGLWDGGDVHPSEYVTEFAEKHSIPRVYESLEAMARDVDCAIIHGCDWDTHVEKARPFVEAEKSILVDKPMAGNLRDIRQLQTWARSGSRITGGSSLRYCYEVQDFLANADKNQCVAHTVLTGCTVDEFNYGIHAYTLLAGILGAGVVSVQHLSKGVQRRVRVNWPDGRMGIVVIGEAAEWIPFYASISTDKDVTQFVAANDKIYRAFLEIALPYLAGEVDEPPVPFDQLIEPELLALAAKISWQENDREVRLDELTDCTVSYNGHVFAEGYRRAKYPEGS